MPKGCQLDASPRSTGPPALTGLAPCNLSPPRPTFTSRRHSPSDVLRSETVALAWFSPERWCSPCNVEHFARATIPARNPLCPVLKVQLLEGILRSRSLGKQTYVRADVRIDSPMFWAAVGNPTAFRRCGHVAGPLRSRAGLAGLTTRQAAHGPGPKGFAREAGTPCEPSRPNSGIRLKTVDSSGWRHCHYRLPGRS